MKTEEEIKVEIKVLERIISEEREELAGETDKFFQDLILENIHYIQRELKALKWVLN